MTDGLFTREGAKFERRVLGQVEHHAHAYDLDAMEMAHRLRAVADGLEAGGTDGVSAENWDPYRHAGVER